MSRHHSILGTVALLALAAVAACQPVQASSASPEVAAPSTTAARPSPTRTPTAKEPTKAPSPTATKASTKPPAKPILERGDSGTKVRELQVRLRKAHVYSYSITGYFGPVTQRAVKAFQRKYGFDKTGAVDRQTWSKLVRVTGTVSRSELFPPPPSSSSGRRDSRCRVGRVICIDKTARKVTWVIDGKVQLSMDARFGSEFTPTREGTFHIYSKDRDHVSTLYHTAMPFAMFFSGGQAVHYSSDFAAKGYSGASHGCVNTRTWSLTERLFNETRIGDKVVVYQS